MERRNTRQRELVLNAVLDMQRHVTADEVYSYLEQKHLKIGRVTVFRDLTTLTAGGKLYKVCVPDGPVRYEPWKGKHYHVRCSVCGDILDVEMPEVKGLEQMLGDTHGARIDNYDIFFSGICPDCLHKTGAETEAHSQALAEQ